MEYDLAEVVGYLPDNDDTFKRRMRIHQSWWRHDRGYAAGSFNGRRLGSLLSADAAAAGHNFLTPGIADLARRMKGKAHVQHNLFDNMLSSQPMAFNLFGPLAIDQELARILIGAVLGRPLFLAVVQLEDTPSDQTAHLNDNTSFDATCRFVDAEGRPGMVAMETKLTEPFSPADAKKRPEREIYRDHAVRSKLYLDPAAPEFAGSQLWQLWRNHLLLESVCRDIGFEIPFRQAWVIHHQDDQRGSRDVAAYRDRLAQPDTTFREFTLDALTARWGEVLPTGWRSWLSDFRRRYVDLSASAALADAALTAGNPARPASAEG